MIIITTEAEFYSQIKKGPCVVDFHAKWCGPCKAIAPKYEQLSKSYPNVKFLKVDVDEVKSVATKEDVKAMPTFNFYVDGTRVDQVVGGNLSQLESCLAKLSSKGFQSFKGTGRTLSGVSRASSNGRSQFISENYVLFGIVLFFIYLYLNKDK